MKFWLGTHRPTWLERVDVPLFVSRRTMPKRRLPRATTEWALDSGGFSELRDFGGWTISAVEYADIVRRYHDQIGNLQWAAPMDWMCEPVMLAKTGKTVAEHQQLTTANFLELRTIAADLPIIPVLQGQTIDDYLHHRDAYETAGIRLEDQATVGVGSVCRRQATDEIERLLLRLAADGLRLHGFGVKTLGLDRYAHALVSADSMAWSLRGYHVDGCDPGHKNEANCQRFALEWRHNMLTRRHDRQLAFI